ncbi:hypothetical protein HK096_007777 [Nowakowskiella sp. JEL0078]|nr:hypothetical protein HK096_007777 [Nowakowskiella sp. JEL0078]
MSSTSDKNLDIAQLIYARLQQTLADLERAESKASSQEWIAARSELERLRSQLGMGILNSPVKAHNNSNVMLDDDVLDASSSACAGWPLNADDYLFDFFISYASNSAIDTRLALELYFRLQLFEPASTLGNSESTIMNISNSPATSLPHKRRVFLDSETLGNTEDWRAGIKRGLKSSKCIILIISHNALNNMKTSDAHIDNVLLEWETAILSFQRFKCIVVPVFVGEAGTRFDIAELHSPDFPSKRFSPHPEAMQCHQSAKTTLAQLANLNSEKSVFLDHSMLKESVQECTVKLINAFNSFSDPSFIKHQSNSAARDLLESFGRKVEGTWDCEKCKLVEELSPEEFELFTHVISVNESWRHLDLTRQNLHGIQARALALAMKVNNTLETLNLKRNEAGKDGAQMLSDALKANAAIQNHMKEPRTRESSPSQKPPSDSLTSEIKSSPTSRAVRKPLLESPVKKLANKSMERSRSADLSRKSVESIRKSAETSRRKAISTKK